MAKVAPTVFMFSAILIVGFVFANKSNSQVAPKLNGLAWEYHVSPPNSNLTSTHLNQLGNQGWELVTIYEDQIDTGFRAVFKRLK